MHRARNAPGSPPEAVKRVPRGREQRLRRLQRRSADAPIRRGLRVVRLLRHGPLGLLGGGDGRGVEAHVSHLPRHRAAPGPNRHPPLKAVRTEGTARVVQVGSAAEPARHVRHDPAQDGVRRVGFVRRRLAVAAGVGGDAGKRRRSLLEVLQIDVATRRLSARVLHVMRLVQYHDSALDVYVHRGPNRRVEQVVVRAKHELGSLRRVLGGEVRAGSRFFPGDDQILDVEGFRALSRDVTREFHGAVAVPTPPAGVLGERCAR